MIEQLQDITLCSAENYRQQLIEEIGGAKQRVLLEAMSLDAEPVTAEILEACQQARKRGPAVVLVYDRFSYALIGAKHGQAGINRFNQSLSSLESSGATLVKVGNSQVNPFAGRHHAKAAVVDNTVYVGGGVNLSSDSFSSHDYMWRIEDQKLADTLYDKLPQAAETRDDDQVLFQNDDYQVLLDAGKANQSLIYQRTCQLAESAESVYYVSKLMPDSQLLEILKTKPTQYWHNTVSSAKGFDKLALIIDQLKHRVDNKYLGQELIHAKFCVFVMSDGSKQAISGSHNFNSRGVKFGTQEIALQITNQAMCDQLIQFSQELSDPLVVN